MTIDQASMTVSDVINARFETLTRAEKQLAGSLLDNYPVSGLGSITTVADNIQVQSAEMTTHRRNIWLVSKKCLAAVS